MNSILLNNKKQVVEVCKSLKVKRLFAFGSVVGGDFTNESDLDFLVSFSEDLTMEEYTENYFQMHYTLQNIFNRTIDLLTERSLSNPYFIENINKTKAMIYEA